MGDLLGGGAIGRRGFLLGLGALVAAPAVIRVAPLMPISARWTPLYVPVNWLTDYWYDMPRSSFDFLKPHAWPRPLDETWINLNDYDAAFARAWAKQLEEENDCRFQGRWS